MEDSLKKSRVILHVDLDAFYCQVEHVRLGIPIDTPLGVQQWNGLIAVNYAARAKGIKRHTTPQEAREKAPDIVFVHVATFANGDTTYQYHTENITYQTHKVSLDPYRNASQKIMSIFERFCPTYQRASIDEAYLDITDLVNIRIKAQMHNWSDAEGVNGDVEEGDGPVVSWLGAGVLVGEQVAESRGWLWLRIAADVSQEIRKTVYDELQYTCSTGIAHNKTLAKICSGLNKPNKQTILRQAEVLKFMESCPMSKIRNLGGKLGDEIGQELHAEKAGDIWYYRLADRKYSLEVLREKFGPQTGTWVYNISRGICHEEVTETSIPKSMLSCKSLRPGATNGAALEHWIGILSNELYTRLQNDHAQYARWPRSLVLHINHGGRTGGTERSKRGDFPAYHLVVNPDIIKEKCLSLLRMSPGSSGAGLVVQWPCDRIAIGVSGFVEEEKNSRRLDQFFTKIAGPAPVSTEPDANDVSISRGDTDKGDVHASRRGRLDPSASNRPLDRFFSNRTSKPDDGAGGATASSSSAIGGLSNPTQPSLGHDKVSEQPDSARKGRGTLTSFFRPSSENPHLQPLQPSHSPSSANLEPPTTGSLASMEVDSVLKMDSEAELGTGVADSGGLDPAPRSDEDAEFRCPKCSEVLDKRDTDGVQCHMDFHVAMELQDSFRPTAPANPQNGGDSTGSGNPRKRKANTSLSNPRRGGSSGSGEAGRSRTGSVAAFFQQHNRRAE
ncbi:uncharacterized protein EV422DRAFT_502663 [Fimicolochytrium jonesii]|uniref:uncharacterized protein n=1 Tax=Fimicolochytrium jonesii TaxID=1396493 RepID=UPI0022FDF0F4|nr:uncharacterized protein EV422DRAFT_502663 [Fimicolochytrium jonesii]KAI8826944.1 hypothetical protein EV422DRAFT_502663 [Fimicolochytrium jonesii]